MGHINQGEGEHDLTASAFVVRTDFDEPKISLHVHKIIKKLFQFGGHVEKDNNPWQTVRNELLEEAGYDIEDLAVLQPPVRMMSLPDAILHPMPVCVNTHEFPLTPYKHSHIDLAFGFVAAGPPAHKVAEGESKDLRCYTRDELLALPGDQIYDDIRKIALFVMDTCMSEWERVPVSDFAL